MTLAAGRAATNPLLPGLFAWWIAVASPAFGGAAPLASRICAVLALGACVAGPLIAGKSPRIGRALGILGFLSLCTGAWLTAPNGLFSRRLDPVLGVVALGAFALFGVGWGAFELESIAGAAAERRREDDAAGAPRSEARASPPRWHLSRPVVFFALAVAAAFALLAASSLAAERERGILAEAAAGAAALGLIASASAVAERPQGPPGAPKPSDFPSKRARLPWSAVACLILGFSGMVLLLVLAR